MADGGSIFLDEIGELSLPMQAKLLRVLQEKTFERVGGMRPVKVDLRIIAATNRNLLDMVEKGTFREDLYYRLNVFPITIPPLRERGSDVILLADHFVMAYANETGKDVKRISTPALNMLMAYHWPGNVRELENVIERSVILSEDGVIHGYNLPPSLQTSTETGTTFGCGLEAKLQAVEYEMIIEAMKTHNGNMTEAAKDLGLTRRILGLRMEKQNINYKAFRKNSQERGREVIEEDPSGVRLSANQRYHLMLADIAMAAAIKTFDPKYAMAGGEGHAPGSVRDAWLAQCTEESLRQRVSAMASAGVNSRKALSADRLAAVAETYGISLADGMSERLADHFEAQRRPQLQQVKGRKPSFQSAANPSCHGSSRNTGACGIRRDRLYRRKPPLPTARFYDPAGSLRRSQLTIILRAGNNVPFGRPNADAVPISSGAAFDIGEAVRLRLLLNIATDPGSGAGLEGDGTRLILVLLTGRVTPGPFAVRRNRHPVHLRVGGRGCSGCANSNGRNRTENNGCISDKAQHSSLHSS